MDSSTQKRLAAHNEIADTLLSLCGEGLHKKENKGYIVLERKLGKSDANKNAVSLLREGVSFMLSDWGFEQESKSLQLNAERSKAFDGQRLIFPDLRLVDVQSHPDFFTRLTQEAKHKAERLQGAH